MKLDAQFSSDEFQRSPIQIPRNPVIVGTRGSALAQEQTRSVIAALSQVYPGIKFQMKIIKTGGDRNQKSPLQEIEGVGIFTKELENALLRREIDLAVHSLKDLPIDLAPGLILAAVTTREDARDCLVSRHRLSLMQLPRGARVGTSSARRTAQLLAIRPDLKILSLRGNVNTRLKKAQSKEYDAVVLAVAGVVRLGRGGEITEVLSFQQMLSDPGQGAIAVEVRADDPANSVLAVRVNHPPTLAAVTAERSFLAALGGGCRMPIGAHAEIQGTTIRLQGLVAALDGSRILRGENQGKVTQAEELGRRLAQKLLPRAERLGVGIQSSPGRAFPLQGKRILVTRAREQARSLVDKILNLGGEAIEFPAIEFAPLEDFHDLDDSLKRIREFDWVVFTSGNGVRFVARRLSALNQAPSLFKAVKLAAIGPATAGSLEELGLNADFIPSKFRGEQMALELPIRRGDRALLLRADIASEKLAQGLITRGVRVKNVEVYRTLEVPPCAIHWQKADALTFTSSSTVRNFTALLQEKDRQALNRMDIFCIGPVTAETAEELGLHVDAIAAEHTINGLLETMVNFYRPFEEKSSI